MMTRVRDHVPVPRHGRTNGRARYARGVASHIRSSTPGLCDLGTIVASRRHFEDPPPYGRNRPNRTSRVRPLAA